jgi:hypothetical protein
VQLEIRRVLDEARGLEADAADGTRVAVAFALVLDDERLSEFLVEDLRLTAGGEEATEHGLVVRHLERRAALEHLVAEALEPELQDVEAQRFVLRIVDDA